ncbi:MAG: hypothetical protein GKR99_03605 [Rhodobacteraceae bacterium]|nr:hypothetical protein [Paracoccaceae bacterium]
MIWIILGVLLWSFTHFFKRLAPGARAAMTDRMGNASRGVIALVLVASIVLMVIGMRSAPFVDLWFLPPFVIHINNLLMLIAVILLGAGSSKSRLRGKLRHPMLAGVVVWSVAHLLVNGHLAAVLLFGGIGLWALIQMQIVNRAEPAPDPFTGGSLVGDIRLLVISAVVFAVNTGIHTWLGVWPFPG